jgi:bacterioferritin-associated ferredoxin
MRHIDEAVRAAHAALHEVEQIGAGGQIGSARRLAAAIASTTLAGLT